MSVQIIGCSNLDFLQNVVTSSSSNSFADSKVQQIFNTYNQGNNRGWPIIAVHNINGRFERAIKGDGNSLILQFFIDTNAYNGAFAYAFLQGKFGDNPGLDKFAKKVISDFDFSYLISHVDYIQFEYYAVNFIQYHNNRSGAPIELLKKIVYTKSDFDAESR